MINRKLCCFLFLFGVVDSYAENYVENITRENNPSCNCGKISKVSALLSSGKSAMVPVVTRSVITPSVAATPIVIPPVVAHSVLPPNEMVEVPSGTFMMGGQDSNAKQDELPRHKVTLNAFYMDKTKVTNEQFGKFVAETGYITLAEKPIDWELIKQQLPPDTPKPPVEKLAPGSLVFIPAKHPILLGDPSQWWRWVNGANWRHPRGPDTEIFGQDHPVVHVSREDAIAYCEKQGKRLPTEAEWEWAARGGLDNKKYPWGDEEVGPKNAKANIWEGEFPYKNNKHVQDQWTSSVKKYPPNAYGLFDMAGNVWEWTADLYDLNYYATLEKQGVAVNPCNTEKSYDPDEPSVKKYVLRGGSYMCHTSYCWGYRVSARMKTTADSSMVNLGFRCVKDK